MLENPAFLYGSSEGHFNFLHLLLLSSVTQFSSVQLLSRVRLSATPWITVRQASLSITNSQSLFKHMPIESVMPSRHLIFCHPLFLLPPIPPSIRVFSNESNLCMTWPKYWSFSFNISPSNEHPGLISFRMAWLDLLAVQGTLKSLLQHHSSKASILWPSAFFTSQLSHPYMTTGKTIALTRQTFLGKVMSLLFNMLSRLVITFLPRSKRLLISWLQSPSAVILEPPQNKVWHCFHCFPIDFPSVTQSCPVLCDPMGCSSPGFPVHHQHLELAQTHIHQVGDAIQPSHPLSSPSPPAFSLSQNQGLF